MMKALRLIARRLFPVLVLFASAWPSLGAAQGSDLDPDAIALLRRTTDYLASLKQFRVDIDSTLEAVYTGGQKIQFGHRIAVAVQRPDKLRADRVGDLVSQSIYYDGKSLSLNLPKAKYHATVQAPPTLEAMLDFARDKLELLAPGADFVYSNAYERLADKLTAASIVGKSVVAGIPCTQIAFRNPEVDWQIWIADGKRPLPHKFVITSKRMPESPQFEVVMTKWETAPKLSEAMFRFTPPKGSRQIEFTPSAMSK